MPHATAPFQIRTTTRSSNRPPHIVAPSALHTHTIVLLHGRGSDATTFQSEIFESQDSQDQFFPDIFPSIKWVFPCAKLRWAAREAEHMHQWFDMTSVQEPWEDPDVQEEGLRESASQLEEIIQQEIDKVGLENVIVGGISQGCAVGLYTLLATSVRVAGFFGISGWLHKMDIAAWAGLEDWKEKPVLLQHCRDDAVVPVANGEDMREQLEEMGTGVRWQCFEDGGHWLNEPRGMDGIVRFVKQIMEQTEVGNT
jgi:lysophospholipase-2